MVLVECYLWQSVYKQTPATNTKRFHGNNSLGTFHDNFCFDLFQKRKFSKIKIVRCKSAAKINM